MKKLFTAAIMLAMSVFVGTEACAQVKFGVKGGLNVTNMSYNKEVFESSNRAGFFIGPTVKFSLPLTGLGIDASALYDQRESEINVPGAGTEKLKTQSVCVPVNLRYGVGLGSLASIFVYGGPQVGFAVGDKDQSLYKDVAAWRLSDSNFSVNVGLGVSLLSHLQVSANYNIACGKTGEMTLAKAGSSIVNDQINNIIGKKGRSNAWQIGLAYYF